AAIHRRKRADHAVAAGGHHQFHSGDEEHGGGDQWKREAIAKAREWIGCLQKVMPLLASSSKIGKARAKNKERRATTIIIPGRSAGPNPESRDSGFTLRVPRNDGAREDENEQPAPRISGCRRTDPAGARTLPVAHGVLLAGRLDELSGGDRPDRADA